MANMCLTMTWQQTAGLTKEVISTRDMKSTSSLWMNNMKLLKMTEGANHRQHSTSNSCTPFSKMQKMNLWWRERRRDRAAQKCEGRLWSDLWRTQNTPFCHTLVSCIDLHLDYSQIFCAPFSFLSIMYNRHYPTCFISVYTFFPVCTCLPSPTLCASFLTLCVWNSACVCTVQHMSLFQCMLASILYCTCVLVTQCVIWLGHAGGQVLLHVCVCVCVWPGRFLHCDKRPAAHLSSLPYGARPRLLLDGEIRE